MNLNHPSEAPLNGENSFHGGFKRHRSEVNEEPAPVFLYSPEVWMEGPAQKRFRHCFSDSPSVVSLSQTFEESLPPSPVRKTPVEWWKQKPRRPCQVAEPPQTDCCFICQRNSLPTQSKGLCTNEVSTGMRENALLAYLTPKHSTKAAVRKNPLEPSWNRHQSTRPCALPSQPLLTHCPKENCCSFCERAACSDCISRCEECGDMYCSFCSTVDYHGIVPRTVCLDCNNACACAAAGNEDAMNID